MPLYIRFSLVISGLVLAVVISTAGILYWAEKGVLMTETRARQDQAVRSLTQVSRESLLSHDDLMLIHYIHNLPKWAPTLIYAYTADAKERRVLAHSRMELLGTSLSRLPATPPGTRVIRAPVRIKGKIAAEVVVGFSEERAAAAVSAALGKARQRIFLVAVVMVAAGLLASFLLSLSLTRPISKLAEASVRLGRGDLGTRVDPGGKDELGRLASAFNTMAGKLEELDQMKKDFVSSVTHELKSPLAAIESNLSLILYESEKSHDIGQWVRDIGHIKEHTSRLSRFITDLLDLAKIERGQFTLHKREMRMEEVVMDVTRFFAPLARENSLRIVSRLPARDLPPVWADPERVRQVWTNLVSNAIKFTPAGGEIVLEVAAEGGELLCSVADTGAGVPPGERERIFEKFAQVKETASVVKGPKGTGLGLAICRKIVEDHGGRIRVESAPGNGSRFIFTLPCAPVASLGRKR